MVKIYTKNELVEYRKKLANDLHNGKITYKEFNTLLDNVQVEGFALNKYTQLNQSDKDIINLNFDRLDILEQKNNKNIYRGFAGDNWYNIAQDLGLKRVVGMYYSEVYSSDEKMIVFSYCEGDISLLIYNDKVEYEKEIQSQIQFFKENY